MNPKGFRPAAHLARRRLRKVGVFIIEVILADVDHRQLPQRSHIHGLVEHSLAKRPIAEETNRYLVTAAHFARHGSSGSNGGATSNDGVSAQVASILVGDMHRANLASTVTCLLDQHFCKHPVDLSSLCHAVSLTTLRASLIVLPPPGH